MTAVQCTTPIIPNYSDVNNFSKKPIAPLDINDSFTQDTDKTKLDLQKLSLHIKNLQANAEQMLESQNNINGSSGKQNKTIAIMGQQLSQRLNDLAHANLAITANTSKSTYDNDLQLLSSSSGTVSQVIEYSTNYNNTPMDEASILAMAAQVSNAMVQLSYNVAVSLTRLTQSFQGIMDMLASLQKILAYVQGYFTAAISCHNSNSNNTHNQMSTWDLGCGDAGQTNFSGSSAGMEWANKVHLDGSRVYLTGLTIPDNVKQFFTNGDQIDEAGIETLLSTVSSSLAAILPDSASFESTNKDAAFSSATIQTFIDNCGTKIKSVNDLLSTYTNQIETAQNAAQQGLSFFSSINNIMNQLIQKLF